MYFKLDSICIKLWLYNILSYVFSRIIFLLFFSKLKLCCVLFCRNNVIFCFAFVCSGIEEDDLYMSYADIMSMVSCHYVSKDQVTDIDCINLMLHF